MATLFLKTGEPGKQEKRYMDKAAVRKFLDRKNDQIESLEGEVQFQKSLVVEAKRRMFVAEKKVKLLVFALGGSIIGYAIISIFNR